MRRFLIAVVVGVLALGILAQTIEAEGGTTPGHAASSPGSPFNEPEINSEDGPTQVTTLTHPGRRTGNRTQ
jgi:hypothetical protein